MLMISAAIYLLTSILCAFQANYLATLGFFLLAAKVFEQALGESHSRKSRKGV